MYNIEAKPVDRFQHYAFHHPALEGQLLCSAWPLPSDPAARI